MSFCHWSYAIWLLFEKAEYRARFLYTRLLVLYPCKIKLINLNCTWLVPCACSEISTLAKQVEQIPRLHAVFFMPRFVRCPGVSEVFSPKVISSWHLSHIRPSCSTAVTSFVHCDQVVCCSIPLRSGCLLFNPTATRLSAVQSHCDQVVCCSIPL